MSEQCEYTKPHPKHHWWIGTTTAGVSPRPSSNYRECLGIRDPNAPTWGEGGLLTHSKQALGGWELWQQGAGAWPPVGERHLHFLFDSKGRWNWVVRWKKSPLCNTPRCRMVEIMDSRRMY